MPHATRCPKNGYLSKAKEGPLATTSCYNPESMNITELLWRVPVTVLLLSFSLALTAQDTEFFIEETSADLGEEVEVNVRALNLNMVVGVQFSVEWDPEVLSFLGVSNVAMEGSLMENFNQTQLDSGRIGYLEVDPALEPFDIQDSSILFTLRFESLVSVGTSTEITFAEAPLANRTTDAENEIIDTRLSAGTINIGGGSSLFDVLADNERFSASPNPFMASCALKVNLDYRSAAVLEALDVSGRIVMRRKISLMSGDNLIRLSGGEFPAAGTYTLRLTTDREQLNRKVIFNRSGR
ncbi:T9SS type A sorting domain-containing protein [Lewinella sp. W8]|nr:T9SS type A sorting domain-containing protein [Lewinella sp. W8]